jgi:hypothetical protein
MRLTSFTIHFFIFISALAISAMLRAQPADSLGSGDVYEAASESATTDSSLTVAYAKYGIDISEVACRALYSKALEWMGVPYRYGSSSTKSIDCSGLVKKLTIGLLVEELRGGSRDIYQQCDPIDRSMLSEGDLVFFKIRKSQISHVGIYLQNNKFIHATVQRGVIISDLDEPYYKTYFFGAARLR